MDIIIKYPSVIFEEVTILFNIVLIVFAFQPKGNVSKVDITFRHLVTVNLLELLAEVLSPFVADLGASYHTYKLFIFSIEYTLAFLMYALFAFYATLYAKYKIKKMTYIINHSIMAITVLLGFSNIFTGYSIGYDEETHSYLPGPLNIAVFYIPMFYFFCYGIISFIRSKSNLEKREFRSIILSFCIMTIGSILQHFLVGKLMVSGMFSFISLFILYMSVESNDYQKLADIRASVKKAENETIYANNAKSTFLANMSHEIRTPMNAILGINNTILSESSEPKITEYATDIKKAGGNLLNIINNVLDISKIEASKLELIEEEYSLTEVISSIYTYALERLEGKNIELNVNVSPSLPDKVYGDKYKLIQILENLVSNACKYTKQGTINVDFNGTVKQYKTGTQSISLLMLTIDVADTGIGISENEISTIYDSFKRADLKENISIEGAGLGLSIVRELVQLMDGEISVVSEYGKGSTFTLELSQEVTGNDKVSFTPEKIKSIKSKGNSNDFVFPDLKGKRILFVDDNDMNLTVAKSLLQKTHADIDLSASGEEGLSLISSNKYDFIFLDHMMPEIDGITVFKSVKQDNNNINKDTPVIIMTANTDAKSQKEYEEIGFDGFLGKPYRKDEIAKILKKMN